MEKLGRDFLSAFSFRIVQQATVTREFDLVTCLKHGMTPDLA